MKEIGPEIGPELPRFVRGVLFTGTVAGLASALAVALCGRADRGRAAPPVAAISHIYSGGSPRRHADGGLARTVLGLAIHQCASVFWAVFYEALFGRKAADEGRPGRALAGGAAISAAAYFTDYYVVARRFRPGFEVCLSKKSMAIVYAVLAAGFGLAGMLRALRPPEERREHRT